MEIDMTLLTKNQIIKTANSNRLLRGAALDWDEPGRCIITLRDGITWNAMDGNRHVESFIYSDEEGDERDTFEYFKDRLRQIEPER
jgi:hypothetical protein